MPKLRRAEAVDQEPGVEFSGDPAKLNWTARRPVNRAEGRLGCPNDYEVFRVGLEPLLQRLHRSLRHKGKTPRHGPSLGKTSAEVIELRNRLRQAVETEAYEEAAQLRDLIRQKEAADGPGASD